MTNKPITPILDPSLALSLGLTHAFLLHERQGQPTDIIGGIGTTASGSPEWVRDVDKNPAIRFDSTNPDYLILDSVINLDARESWSIAFGCQRFVASTATTNSEVMGEHTTTDSFLRVINNSLIIERVGASVNFQVTDPLDSGQDQTNYVLNHYGGTVSSSMDFSVDGRFLGEQVTPAFPAEFRISAIGKGTSAADEWNGTISYLYTWDRFLNQDEIALLHKDPYIVFRGNVENINQPQRDRWEAQSVETLGPARDRTPNNEIQGHQARDWIAPWR